MTMHMLGPYMTTTNTRKRKSKKSQKQKQADIAHDKWLRKMGAHPDQRSVAQPGSVSGLGPEGRKFKSCHSDQHKGDKCYGSTTGSKPVGVGSTPAIPLSNKIVAIDNSGKLDTEIKMMYSSQYVVGQAYNKGGTQVLSKQEANDPSTGKRR